MFVPVNTVPSLPPTHSRLQKGCGLLPWNNLYSHVYMYLDQSSSVSFFNLGRPLADVATLLGTQYNTVRKSETNQKTDYSVNVYLASDTFMTDPL